MSNNGPSVTQLIGLMEARAADESAQAAAKATAARKREMELEVHEAMVWAGWKGEHKIDLGPPWGVQGFTPKATETGNIFNEERYLKWIREHGREGELTGDVQFRKQPLNMLVKRARRGHAELPDGVEPVERPYVSVRNIT